MRQRIGLFDICISDSLPIVIVSSVLIFNFNAMSCDRSKFRDNFSKPYSARIISSHDAVTHVTRFPYNVNPNESKLTGVRTACHRLFARSFVREFRLSPSERIISFHSRESPWFPARRTLVREASTHARLLTESRIYRQLSRRGLTIVNIYRISFMIYRAIQSWQKHTALFFVKCRVHSFGAEMSKD